MQDIVREVDRVFASVVNFEIRFFQKDSGSRLFRADDLFLRGVSSFSTRYRLKLVSVSVARIQMNDAARIFRLSIVYLILVDVLKRETYTLIFNA